MWVAFMAGYMAKSRSNIGMTLNSQLVERDVVVQLLHDVGLIRPRLSGAAA
jgi:hypothetical protein